LSRLRSIGYADVAGSGGLSLTADDDVIPPVSPPDIILNAQEMLKIIDDFIRKKVTDLRGALEKEKAAAGGETRKDEF
jgi:hypothetical protein